MITVNDKDTRKFDHLLLDNGLEVVLVEDDKADKSSASLTVSIGHFDDPEPFPGLVHLLEHMLFLGSENFPQPGEFNGVVSQHGGSLNAWTSSETSCFHFDVQSPLFTDCLQRFADMFISPLLSLELIEKEKQSIDAEFRMKLNDDLRRLYQVDKETANPAHPFSRFASGNIDTLGDDNQALQVALKALHQQNYLAKNCKLAVVSNIPLAQQSELIKRCFSGLSNENRPDKTIQVPLYRPEDLAQFINVEPTSPASRLIISFALPNVDQWYKSKPSVYLSNLIGDEGQGSLLAYLREKEWATNLSAGGGISGSNFKDFNINIQLTEQGQCHVDEVIESLFSLLALIAQQGIERWRFSERKKIADLVWQTMDPDSSVKFANLLSANLNHYALEHLACGDILFECYEEAIIRQLLSYFTPQNMRVKRIWKGLDTDAKAQYFGTSYGVSKFSEAQINRWLGCGIIEALSLSEPNPYVNDHSQPHELASDNKIPVRLCDTEALRFWHLQEPKFRSVKGSIHFALTAENMDNDIKDAVLKKLFIALLRDSVNQRFYSAEIAGLGYDMYSTQSGMTIKTSGFSHGQWALLKNLVTALYESQFSLANFERLKQALTHNWRGRVQSKPVTQLFSQLSVKFQPGTYAPCDMADSLEMMSYIDLLEFRKRLLSKVHLEVFAHGDWTQQLVQQAFDPIYSYILSLSEPGEETTSLVQPLMGTGPKVELVESQQNDSAVVFYFQGNESSARQTAYFIVIEQLISSVFFNQLRTERQLGYLVGTGYSPINQVPGVAAYVQSPGYCAADVYQAIAEFFDELPEQLVSLPEEMLDNLKASVCHQLVEKDTSLSIKNQRLWLSIANKDYDFSEQHRIIHQVQQMTLKELNQFVGEYFHSQKQLFVLYSLGKANAQQLISVSA